MKRWLTCLTTLFLACLLSSTAWSEVTSLPNPISPATAKQLYDAPDNAIAGNPNGDVTLVEFFDYNCPFCRKTAPVIQRLIKKNPNLRVVYKEFLLFGDPSIPATAAALAAVPQNKYLAMHDALLTAKHPLTLAEVLRIAKNVGLDTDALEKSMNSAAVKKQIADNTQLTTTLNLSAAPAFIVTSTQTAKQPNNNPGPQYLFLGSIGAEKNLQLIIDKLSTKG